MKYPIRSMVVAPPGKVLLAFDLSQAEAWIVAFLSDEEKMKQALMGGDIHSQTACVILDKEAGSTEKNGKLTKEERYLGKKCNHAFNYRMGPERATQVINKEGLITISVKQAKKYRQAYLEYYFGVQKWWREIEESLRIQPTLFTPYGRRRNFYQIYGQELFKEATAYIPQSTVADHMFGAVQKELGIRGGIIGVRRQIIKPSNGEIIEVNTSHDSLLMEVPQEIYKEIAERTVKQLLRPLIVNGETFVIPVDAEVGDRYGELEKLKVA